MGLAYAAGKSSGTMPAVLNAANEMAISLAAFKTAGIVPEDFPAA